MLKRKHKLLRKPALRSPIWIWLSWSFVMLGSTLSLSCGSPSSPGSGNSPVSASSPALARLEDLVWVAYSPPKSNPNQQIEASVDDIRADLNTLRQAGFTGLVTYGATGTMGRELPRLAQLEGFSGLIVGVWDPGSREEVTNAAAAAKNPIVLGICVGNEGLDKRYKFSTLAAAVAELKKTTGKLISTTEELEDYANEELLDLGDWVFPNVHPYFHNELTPDGAVRWTQAAYDELVRRSQRLVILKEVGLPTAGDPQGRLSEENQDNYYARLAQTKTRFVYFEAFDQPWKTHLPVESHWGLFSADRAPKLVATRLMKANGVTAASVESSFYVYQDVDSQNNHYQPTGYMGDIGDIHVNPAFRENPHSGTTAIRVVYDAKGNSPNECEFGPPCNWAGVYWQEPANNWGKNSGLKGRGFDLSGQSRLRFWARADRSSTVEFKVGGISEPYGDTLQSARAKTVDLTTEWKEFEIDLTNANLKHIIGGFAWISNREQNPKGVTFYLDEIRFVK